MSFAGLAKLTVTQPDRAMAALRALKLPMATRWALLALTCALSALLVGLLVMLFPATTPAEDPAAALSEALARRPLLLAAVQFAGVTVFAVLVHQVGRVFGGTGTLPDSLLALTWIDLMLVAAEVVQLVVILVLPMLAPILSTVIFGLMIYLFVRMVGAVHGFTNPLLVALGIVATLIVAGFVLSLVISPATIARLGGTPA